MSKKRVVLANELRSYRESIGAAIQTLRPHIEVIVVEPESLEGMLTSLSVDLVICSELTAVVQREARDWVELYPGGEPLARVSFGGRSYTCENFTLSHLLSLVDALESLNQAT